MKKQCENERETIDPSEPLHNMRWEAFCQYYAGECWGVLSRAYEKAGYKHNTGGNAATLIKRPVIHERIKFLRQHRLKVLEVDQLWIALRRKEIAENADKASDRLHALKDLEGGLGLKLNLEQENSSINAQKLDIQFNFEGRKDETN